jgi:hypothetical protein
MACAQFQSKGNKPGWSQLSVKKTAMAAYVAQEDSDQIEKSARTDSTLSFSTRAPSPMSSRGSTTEESPVSDADALSGNSSVVKELARLGAATAPKDNGIKGKSPRTVELQRKVQQLLNKVCPENIRIIAKQLADINVCDSDELTYVCGLIFNRGLHDRHYSDAIADLFVGLVSAWNQVPSATCGDDVANVQAVLTQRCLVESEALFASLEEEAEERKHHMIGFMQFLGSLFLRELVSPASIGLVLQNLLHYGADESLPMEVGIECACGLLRAVAAALQEYAGGVYVSSACDRLLELQQSKKLDGKTSSYSKRVLFLIQDVVDLRNAQWVHKEFKNVAKTKEDIRKDALAESLSKQKGGDGIVKVVAGRRPESVMISPKPQLPKKTKKKLYFCKVVAAGNTCPKGEKCGFAHTLQELTGYKSILCRNFTEQGSCQHGERCTFAHGPHELISQQGTSVDSKTPASCSQDADRSKTLVEPSAQVSLRVDDREEVKHVDDVGKTQKQEKTLAGLADVPLWRAAREQYGELTAFRLAQSCSQEEKPADDSGKTKKQEKTLAALPDMPPQTEMAFGFSPSCGQEEWDISEKAVARSEQQATKSPRAWLLAYRCSRRNPIRS